MSKLFSFLSTFVLLVLPYFSYGQLTPTDLSPQKKQYLSLVWLDKDFKSMVSNNFSKGIFYVKVNYKTEEDKKYYLIFDVYSKNLVMINEVKSGVNNGKSYFYDSEDRLKIVGNYTKGKKSGNWIDYYYYDYFKKEFKYDQDVEFVSTIKTPNGEVLIEDGNGVIELRISDSEVYNEHYQEGKIDCSFIINGNQDSIYIISEKQAELKSKDRLKKYLRKELKGIKYEIYHEKDLSMRILINEKGKVVDIEMVDGFTEWVNGYLLKALRNTDDFWEAAEYEGRKVSSYYNYSVKLFDIIKPIKVKNMGVVVNQEGVVKRRSMFDPYTEKSIYDLRSTIFSLSPANLSPVGLFANSLPDNSPTSITHRDVLKAKRKDMIEDMQKYLLERNFGFLLRMKNITPPQ
ncbi:hypothetical protein [Flammeovirga sp. EKP202]|uniref:hypothetical protein n=1 Tax=Flammeovirga sp. EKP202 TaxID=2770592 RepID=UPI00165F1056|nr:hypothetical protein [Flammeovirga sp. EKP202]MBD0400126.1 hypothetical protein [Flammeovirga sp. EKP202]